MSHELLLVGSIPYDTVQDVFKNFGAKLGKFINAMPDGEVGPRSHWISRVHYHVLALHPDLEVVQRPALENGADRLNPRNAGDSWKFKVRDGVKEVRFGDPGWRLGYARDAINSYFVYKTMQEKGILPNGPRFQVSMPMVNSVLPSRIFPNMDDMYKVRPGFTEALKQEMLKIVEKIPNGDLAIQWDCASELQDAYGNFPGLSAETAIDRNKGQITAISPYIPPGVVLGYHMCFGTLGGWPRFEPDDIGGAVRMANSFIANSGRQVDWIHIPLLDRKDEAFYAPLAELKPQDARIYLGLIHHMESLPQRMALAKKYCADFGLAAYCGFGRIPQKELGGILNDHLKAIGQSA